MKVKCTLNKFETELTTGRVYSILDVFKHDDGKSDFTLINDKEELDVYPSEIFSEIKNEEAKK